MLRGKIIRAGVTQTLTVMAVIEIIHILFVERTLLMPKNLTYSLTWRNKYLTIDAETIEDMIQAYEEALQPLREMKAAGITLDQGAADDYALLVTDDPESPKSSASRPRRTMTRTAIAPRRTG